MKLFIVEDSTLQVERLMKLIKYVHGVEICGAAENMEEALDKIKIYNPDFIILDVLLKGQNSLEKVDEIFKLVPKVLIAVFTNYPYNVFKKYSTEKGISHFFDKSKDLELLLELIKSSSINFKIF